MTEKNITPANAAEFTAVRPAVESETQPVPAKGIVFSSAERASLQNDVRIDAGRRSGGAASRAFNRR